GNVCCGRALISKGLLNQAHACQTALIAQLGPAAMAGIPIVGCEPSCVFTMKDELPELARGSTGAKAIAREARMVDELLAQALDDGGLTVDVDASAQGKTI